jgi:UDP-2,3-diacylglucosamine hydrolase
LLTQLQASDAWDRVLLVSDLHLHAGDPATAQTWHEQLLHSDASALIVLGDYFDLWVGDDLLSPKAGLSEADQVAVSFWQMCARQLRTATELRPIYWMVGNRDFLVGEAFAQATGVQLLTDPCCLQWGEQRWLLSHGDAWCSSDTAYQAFRQTVRSPAWQQTFLSLPLSERLAQGRAMRERSQAHQQQQRVHTDVVPAEVLAAMTNAQASNVIHGHTHQGRSFALGQGMRHVLSDWDATAHPPRTAGLWVSAQGVHSAVM